MKFQREVPLFSEIPEFPFNTVQNGWKEAHTPKTSKSKSTASIIHFIL